MRQSPIVRPLLVLAGFSVVLGVAPPAHGDPDVDEAAFLASLRSAGVNYSTPDGAVKFAKVICRSMGSGELGPQMIGELKNQNPGLTTDHATSFLAIAAKFYCPQQLGTR